MCHNLVPALTSILYVWWHHEDANYGSPIKLLRRLEVGLGKGGGALIGYVGKLAGAMLLLVIFAFPWFKIATSETDGDAIRQLRVGATMMLFLIAALFVGWVYQQDGAHPDHHQQDLHTG
jgi:hypothetical protein